MHFPSNSASDRTDLGLPLSKILKFNPQPTHAAMQKAYLHLLLRSDIGGHHELKSWIVSITFFFPAIRRKQKFSQMIILFHQKSFSAKTLKNAVTRE